jgi:hypothetical protein
MGMKMVGAALNGAPGQGGTVRKGKMTSGGGFRAPFIGFCSKDRSIFRTEKSCRQLLHPTPEIRACRVC